MKVYTFKHVDTLLPILVNIIPVAVESYVLNTSLNTQKE